jgi:hypothetical protein
MIKKSTSGIDWESCFAQATEDVTTFQWAVSVWRNPPEDTSADYLLILICANRTRGIVALKMMQQPELPKDFQPYISRLSGIWQDANRQLNSLLISDKQKIVSIIKDNLVSRLGWFETKLHTVQTTAEDIIVSDDAEWFSNDLKETAQDFLLYFQDIDLVKQSLSDLDIVVHEFESSFQQLETFFKDIFGYFKPVGDFLSSMRDREYGMDRWWLTETPDPDMVIDREFSVEDLNAILNPDAKGKLINTSDCPSPQRLIAFALEELEKDKCSGIMDHIQSCKPCNSFALDIRSAAKEAEQKQDEIPAVPDKLLSAIAPGITSENYKRLLYLAVVFKAIVNKRIKMQPLQPLAFALVSAASAKPFKGVETIPLEMTLKPPRSGFVQIPSCDDNGGGKDFIQNLLQGAPFYSHVFSWDVAGNLKDLGMESQHKQPREVAVVGVTDILVIVGINKTDVESAAKSIPEWLKKGTGSISQEKIPDSVVLLWYRISA